MTNQEIAYTEIERLVKEFKNMPSAQRKGMNEMQTRLGYILPMFRALGWDINNINEVSPEEKVSRGWVDFSFRLGNVPRFFLETKRVNEDLNDPRWVTQAIDYAWTKSVTWALLSDFEGLRVFNAEWKESDPFRAQFISFDLDSYLSEFDRLWWLSKPETSARRLDIEAEKVGKKIKRLPVSQNLFDDLKRWRENLFKNYKAFNPIFSTAQVDEAVLRLLNRLIFIRTAEDREVEEYRLRPLLRVLKDQKKIRKLDVALGELFRELDGIYNSELFAKHFSEELKIPPTDLEEIINGLYEKNFTRYNFNALDADVLGTAYEQYLGHVVIDTPLVSADAESHVQEKKTKRKSQGIYYTPAFVTKYIVQQTVGKYLSEHGYNASKPPRVLDMACGSGSFLIEAFDVIDDFVAKERGHAQKNTVDFYDRERQLEVLQKCIYGVDKDKQAVEVARLNLLLRGLHSREKLPMLGNIRYGNSLVSGKDEELKDYFGDNWNKKESFNWDEEFQGIIDGGGFDIILGNPPYFNIETLGKSSLDAGWIKKSFPDVWMDKSDILFYFIARAIQLTKGKVSFIVSRSFLEADKAQKLRKFILDNCAIEQIIDFQDFKVFEDANISTAIFVLRREADVEKRNSTKIRIVKIHTKDGNGFELLNNISNLEQVDEFTNSDFSLFTYSQNLLDTHGWSFSHGEHLDITQKIDGEHPKLSELCYLGEGMQTGANEVFSVNSATIKKYKLEKKYLRKHISNSGIRRYWINFTNQWLIWVEDFENIEDCPPNIANYLKEHKNKLVDRAAYKRGNCKWFRFTWTLHSDMYVYPKIMSPYRSSDNRFALDFDAEYLSLTDTTILFLKKDDTHSLEYYLALLNSKLLTFRYKSIGKKTGGGIYEYFKNGIGRLPIRQLDFSDEVQKSAHDEIVKLVKKMLTLQKERQTVRPEDDFDRARNLDREIERIDDEIDQRVYALYGLTEEEINIVKGGK